MDKWWYWWVSGVLSFLGNTPPVNGLITGFVIHMVYMVY